MDSTFAVVDRPQVAPAAAGARGSFVMSADTVTTRRPMRADARRNRERILTAAAAAFEEHGPDAALEDIASRACVGIGTLYRHFPDRQALLVAVYRDGVDSLVECGCDLLANDDPFDALARWLGAQLEHSRRHQSLAASAMLNMLDDPDGPPPPCEAMMATGAALLARAQEHGVVRADIDANDISRMVGAIALATDGAPDGPICSDRLFHVLLDGLRPPASR
jgi:AcrR family transcriptional regulator